GAGLAEWGAIRRGGCLWKTVPPVFAPTLPCKARQPCREAAAISGAGPRPLSGHPGSAGKCGQSREGVAAPLRLEERTKNTQSRALRLDRSPRARYPFKHFANNNKKRAAAHGEPAGVLAGSGPTEHSPPGASRFFQSAASRAARSGRF